MAHRLTSEHVRRAAHRSFPKEDLLALARELDRVGGGEPYFPYDHEEDPIDLLLREMGIPAALPENG